MFRKINSKKELLIISSIFTLIFYLVAHGYRFFSPMFSGDSLYMIHQNDSAWQIALGRIVQPFLILIRGGIINPFLIAVICIILLSLSVYFLADYLEINRFFSVVLIAAVMACNPTVLCANATYVNSSDFYALALFLSILGVWLIKKSKLSYILMGIIALSLSLGIYQAYICVSIALVMIHFLFQMFQLPTIKETAVKLVKYLISFLIAAVIYYIVWKIFQRVFNVWTANTYNGLASVGDYSDTSLWTVITTTYYRVFHYFMNPEVFTTIPFREITLSVFWTYFIRICNIGTVIIMTVTLIKKNICCNTKLWHRIFQVFIIIMFPLGINFVCIISKGMEHTLMLYAFVLVYVLAIKAIDNCPLQTSFDKRILCTGLLSFIVIISWSNIVFSNQVYLKKDLQDKATHSLLTRIVYEIESTDGYVPGITPVAFSGSFEKTTYIQPLENFEEIVLYGMGNSSLTYIGTDYAYLKYILNVNMNLTRIDAQNEAVMNMPVYPSKGSVSFVDGTLVIKISE